MQCPNCRGQISDDAKFCPLCGKPVEIPKIVDRFCPNCGIKLVPNAAFCNGCGTKITNYSLQEEKVDAETSKNEGVPSRQIESPMELPPEPQSDSVTPQIDLDQVWDTLLSIVFKLPGLKIDRTKFLRDKLSPLCSKGDVDQAIEQNPITVINPKIIARIANDCIEDKQKTMSSFKLKVATMALSQTAIGPVLEVLNFLGIQLDPAGFGPYYFLQVKLIQELAYLYGFPELFDNTGKPLANTIDLLTTCIAVTVDEQVAKDRLKLYLQKQNGSFETGQNEAKLDKDVLKRILPSLIMVSKDKFKNNSKILQNYLHVIYFGEIPPEENQTSNIIVRLLDLFGFILSFPWGGISYKKFKKRPVWRRAINWLYAGFLCCAIFAFVSEYSETPLLQYEFITDSRDGHSYKSMTIDGKRWIMENMQYNVPGSICENCSQKGRLYTFIDALEACPEGFGLPSQNEYQSLLRYAAKNKSPVQMAYEYLGKASYASGNALKSKTNWNGKEKGADMIGFGAVPTGFYSIKDSVVKRSDGTTGFWTSDMTEKGFVRMKIDADEDAASFGPLNRNYGFSVRCVENVVSKDERDSILIKIAQQDLNEKKNPFDWPSETILKKMKRYVKYKAFENDIWNIHKQKMTNKCILFTAKLKKDIAECKKGSLIELYSVRHDNKMSYLANRPNRDVNDSCSWIVNSIDGSTFGNEAAFEWSEWGQYMLDIYASCGIELKEFDEDEF